MKPQIISGDVYAGLLSLTDNLVDVAITSPPYWGQRDYGFEHQIGSEKTPQEYINKLVVIFSLLRQKMSSNGIFFLNVGDKYLSKYGKTPLGFIPYELAHYMVSDGWILNDIIIWHKPNHMPSSVKNRFTNSYEPVFVFSKSSSNIFNRIKDNSVNYTNILKVNLQPTPYNHVAVYPEKLVLELLNKVELNDHSVILDPFAGSGTTLKVALNYNPSFQTIMIENNKKYIKIINDRCKLNNHVDIQIKNFIPYYTNQSVKEQQLSLFEKTTPYNSESRIKNGRGFVKIFNDQQDYYQMLNQFMNQAVKMNMKNKAIFFIGIKHFDNELIYKTSLLNKNGWVIRNVIIVDDNCKWYPIFMIVDDNKKYKYNFNYKNLKLKSKNESKRNWNLTNFIGYGVSNSNSKNKLEGQIEEIISKRQNGFPEYVIVRWGNDNFTKEFVIESPEALAQNLKISFHNELLNIQENQKIISLEKSVNIRNNSDPQKSDFQNNNQYNGKFKNEKRLNWGASPGARSSVENEYFSMRRLYEVDQNLIADYLNLKRIDKGLTKQGLTQLFPDNYKHTVGHWLRKDFGGSLPKLKDWYKLAKILDIEDQITNYVCKTALKIQTVKNGEYKVPQDFISSKSLYILDDLIKCE